MKKHFVIYYGNTVIVRRSFAELKCGLILRINVISYK